MPTKIGSQAEVHEYSVTEVPVVSLNAEGSAYT